MFTLEEVECSAACTLAPAVQVNYRYERTSRRSRSTTSSPTLRNGQRNDIPQHGMLATVRQTPTDKWADSGHTEVHSG